MAKVRAHLVISGIVQGVGFRYSAQDQGTRLGLHGWVRNLPSGQVEAEVEGDQQTVDAFIAWCRRGPSMSQVDDVEVTLKSYSGDLGGFRITR